MIRELISSKPKQQLVERLSKLLRHKDPIEGQELGCIEFGGRVDSGGYARLNFRFDGKHVTVRAHRFFYVLSTGKNIPRNMVVDHKCLNRRCCNPAHLQLVSGTTNSKLVHKRRASRQEEAARTAQEVASGERARLAHEARAAGAL
jgi:hypothetical protein